MSKLQNKKKNITEKKRRRGEGSSSPAPPPLIKIPESSGHLKYYVVTEMLGWTEFVKPPAMPCIPLVIEFYAHLDMAENDIVRLHGTNVEFSADAINKALGLEPVPRDTDSFVKIKQGSGRLFDLEIEHTLSLGKGLRFIRQGTTVTTDSLCVEDQFWREFMTSRLLGDVEDKETTRDQQLLLFCIVLGRRFDVGQVIYAKLDTMRRSLMAKEYGNMCLSFPSLITKLCKEVTLPDDI